jgi:hypothetical protein
MQSHHRFDVEVFSDFAGERRVPNDVGESAAMLHQQRADQRGEIGVLFGEQCRTQHPEPPRNSELPRIGQDQAHMHDSIGSSTVAFLPIRPRAGCE